MSSSALRILVLALAGALVPSCGGGGGYGTGNPPPPPPPPVTAPLDFAEAGMAVIKVRSSIDGATLLEDKARPLAQMAPQRRLTLLDQSGAVRARYSPPEGSSLIDFAQHASGEISVALDTARTVTLVRLDRSASVIAEFPLLDPQAPGDPYLELGPGMRDDTSMVPVWTRDAVRLAPTGQDGSSLVVALRTGRNAVVAYRFAAAPAGYALVWRTLVEPGFPMFPMSITSGTFDTFGQLENHLHVHVDADAAGNIAVGVSGNPAGGPLFVAHGVYFHETEAIGNIQVGALVTRIAADGQRAGTTAIDTVRRSELHGMRLHPNGVALAGRVFTERRDDGGGWNAYVANVDPSSGFYRVIDVDQGDALFDIARIEGARYLAGGATGYTQNPDGASILEPPGSKALLVVLKADGSVDQRIDVPAGARVNAVRSIAPRGNDWLVGSLVNGPGTHSGDIDPSLITADGSAREVALP